MREHAAGKVDEQMSDGEAAVGGRDEKHAVVARHRRRERVFHVSAPRRERRQVTFRGAAYLGVDGKPHLARHRQRDVGSGEPDRKMDFISTMTQSAKRAARHPAGIAAPGSAVGGVLAAWRIPTPMRAITGTASASTSNAGKPTRVGRCVPYNTSAARVSSWNTASPAATTIKAMPTTFMSALYSPPRAQPSNYPP